MNKLFLFMFVTLMLVGSAFAIVSGSETMTRTLPTNSVAPGSTFTVRYTAVGTSGDFGVSVQETITGGCSMNGYKFVLTSPATTYDVTMTAPLTGNCVFSGDYKYGTNAIISFPTGVVNVQGSGACTPVIQCGSWSACDEAGKQTRTCTDGCGGSNVETKSCIDGGTGSDSLCTYMGWAKAIDEDNYCVIGLGISVLVIIFVFAILFRK